jgi:hypothetical protein
MPPTGYYESAQRKETHNGHPGKDGISATGATYVRSDQLRASPNSRGGSHVEVHRSLAALCLLSACRINRKVVLTSQSPRLGAFLFYKTKNHDHYSGH